MSLVSHICLCNLMWHVPNFNIVISLLNVHRTLTWQLSIWHRKWICLLGLSWRALWYGHLIPKHSKWLDIIRPVDFVQQIQNIINPARLFLSRTMAHRHKSYMKSVHVKHDSGDMWFQQNTYWTSTPNGTQWAMVLL